MLPHSKKERRGIPNPGPLCVQLFLMFFLRELCVCLCPRLQHTELLKPYKSNVSIYMLIIYMIPVTCNLSLSVLLILISDRLSLHFLHFSCLLLKTQWCVVNLCVSAPPGGTFSCSCQYAQQCSLETDTIYLKVRDRTLKHKLTLYYQ